MNILQQFTNELHHSLNVRLKALLNDHPINPIDHIELSRLATAEKMHRYMRNLSNVTAEKHENDDPLASFATKYPEIAHQLQADLDETNDEYAGELFTNWVMNSHNNINEITDPFEPFSLLDRFNKFLIERQSVNTACCHHNNSLQSGDDYITDLLDKLD